LKKWTVIDHPVAHARLTTLRDENTQTEDFRRALGQLGLILLLEATRDLATKDRRVRTPLAPAKAKVLSREILLVPILRAGQGLISLVDQFLPEACIGYLGMARNEESLQPESYLEKLPSRLGRYEVIVCDPMLATGGSAIAAGNRLKKLGAKRIRFVHALASPEGISALRKAFPKESIITASVDDCLNDKGYIMPGLGDAGDRCFGC
jgi:uracil phosphoribosyltransferase